MNSATETAVSQFKPNSEQEQRSAALKRFNWLYVYTPILLLSAVALVLLGLMIFGVLAPNRVESVAPFLSGLADIFIILTVLPLLLLCALPTAAVAGVWFYRRNQRQTQREQGMPPTPAQQYGRLRLLFWKLGNLIDKIQDLIQTHSPKLANPVITANGLIAFITTFFNQLKQLFLRRNS